MSQSRLPPFSELYPADLVGERCALWDAFWHGADVGRPMFIPVPWENRPFGPPSEIRSQAQILIDRLRHQAASPVDVVPSLEAGHGGTVVLASAFGGQTHRTENDKWHIDPILRTPDDAFALTVPGDPASGLLAGGLAIADQAGQLIDIRLPRKVPDMQGPLQTAAFLWGVTEFMLAMYDCPDAVKHTLDVVTQHIINVIGLFRARLPDAELVCYPPGHLPPDMGCSIVEDYCDLLSPDLFEEFGLPYINRISDAFGGVAVHCCARFKKHWPAFLRIRNLTALDTMFPFTKPDEVYATFPGIVHSMGLDYAEGQRSFKNKGPDAWLQFLLERTPRTIRWQFVTDCDNPGTVERQLALAMAHRPG